MAGLEGEGIEISSPSAGACLWIRFEADLPHTEASMSRSTSFAAGLLEAHNLVVTPGVIFGSEYDSFVRLAAVRSDEYLREAAQRLRSYLGIVKH